MAVHDVNCKYLFHVRLEPGTQLTERQIKVGVGVLPSLYVPAIPFH